jgi:GMP synthase-like glutamine amidotransferase
MTGPGRPVSGRRDPDRRPGRLLVVEHGRHAPAGLLADWAAARSMRIRTVALHAGRPLPAAPDFDAAVVLGSELTAYDDTLPWLAGELAFIERMLAASVPVLGICFGAQALARVLGARLYRLAEPEFGWAHVASEHPGLAEGPWLSWHRDAFDLPAGAARIATNDVCVQGFSYGPHTGLQFHPEATQPIAASWLRFTVPPPGEQVTGPLFRDANGAWDRAAAHAGRAFSAWLDGGLAGP